MPRQTLGSQRTSGINRVIGLVALVVTAPVLIPVVAIAGLIYMALDVLKRIVMDSGASGNGVIMGGLEGIFMWYLKVIKWAVVGREWPGFVPRRA